MKKKKDEEAYWDDDKAEEAKARGNAFFKEGKWPDAIKEYEEATKRNPRNPIYWQCVSRLARLSTERVSVTRVLACVLSAGTWRLPA